VKNTVNFATARALELAWAMQLDFRFLGIRAEDAQRQELATVCFIRTIACVPSGGLPQPTGQSAL
jgi:hypothetical protein